MSSPSANLGAAPNKKVLIVGLADMATCSDLATELVAHSLGSCLGIAIYDPIRKVGGLLHVMLPDSTIDPAKAERSPCMFIDSGVPRLFHAVYALGGEKSRMVIKVAGGSQFMDDAKIFNIGRRNVEALQALVARNGVSIHKQDTGGRASRTMRLDLPTGSVTINSPGNPPHTL